MNKLDKQTNILIATFSVWKNNKRTSLNGNVEPLLDFFVPKVRKTVLIDQPYPGSDIVLTRIEVYEKGAEPKVYTSSALLYPLYPFLKIVNYHNTHPSFKLRDFFSIIDWCLRDQTIFDYFIGLESVNAIAGILLRRLGRIKKVIYYVSDYSPNRFRISIINRFYLWLDRFCATNADVIWDVSKAMQPARINAGLDPKKSAPVLHVPNALYPAQIAQEPPDKIIPYSLVFMGTLGPENGPDIAIEAVAFLVKKFPQVKLHIVGGGSTDMPRLENLVDKFRLHKHVVFHGFFSEREKISQLIRMYAVALAPYRYIHGSPRLYGDATKIRAYLAAGLPVITTHVPPLGRQASDFGAALQAEDNPQAFATVVEKIFLDRKLYLSLRKKAIQFAKENTWENEFRKAFERMEKLP